MNHRLDRTTARPARTRLTSNAPADAGFSLIELLIVMSIMLILMAAIVPQVTRMKKNANQTSAIQSMRAIGQAEISYNSTYPTQGYACTLQSLGGDPKSGAPSPQGAQLLDPTLASTGIKSGYVFSVTNCTKVTVNNQDTFTSYQLTAVPQAPGKTGDLGYCSDENNIIKSDPAGGTNCTQPIQ